MINVPCGYDPHRRFQRRGGCGVWVGYEMRECLDWFYHRPPHLPYFHNGIALCGVCVKGLRVRHLGQGVFVRPKDESDKQPAPAGPGLEDLY